MDIASALLNSSGAGLGSGASVKVQRGVGLKRGEVSGLPQTDRSRYLGLFRVGSSGSSNGFPALLSWFSTLVAHVVSSTVLFLFVTLSVIPVKETYGRDAEFTEDGQDGRIRATEYAGGNGTRKRGRDAERIT